MKKDYIEKDIVIGMTIYYGTSKNEYEVTDIIPDHVRLVRLSDKLKITWPIYSLIQGMNNPANIVTLSIATNTINNSYQIF